MVQLGSSVSGIAGRNAQALALVFASVLLLAAPVLACTGDCDGSGSVTVAELTQGVNIVLGQKPMSECPEFDSSSDAAVTIDELIGGVKAALDGCPEPVISTIAGTGIAGLNADGQSPLATQFYLPQDVTVGPDGNVYIVDWNNHRIRRIRNGVVETFAGSGYIGDGMSDDPATIDFNHPTNVCFDHDGNMIVAAWHNSLVKKIVLLPDGSPGEVTNLAGTGARAFGGDEGPGNQARLDLPSSVCVDTIGNIIISDQANYRLRLLEPNGIIHTLAGNGTPGDLGDGGPATLAELNGPKGQSAPPASRITIDARNRLYVADTGNHKIRLIDERNNISTIVGTGTAGYSGDKGPAKDAELDTPSDVAITPNGTLYIADTFNHVVRVVTPDGMIDTFAGTGERGFSGDGGPARQAKLDRPYGVEIAANGNVYIADTHNQRIREVFGVNVSPPPTPEPTPPPTIIPCTNMVGSICTYAGTGGTGFSGEGQNRLEATFYWPFDIEFTKSGRRLFLDWNNHLVREITSDDTVHTIMGTDFVGDGPKDLSDLTPAGADPFTVDLNHPTDIQEMANGDLILAAWHNHKLRELSKADGRVRVLLGNAAGFAYDGCPTGDGCIAKVTRVNQPPHFVVDPSGNLFLIDQRNQRIRVLYDFEAQRANSIVQTVVGTGMAGFNGDGPALQTQINLPAGGNPEPSGGIALDADGALYFSDSNNNRIRKVVFSDPGTFQNGVVTTIAGTGDKGFSGEGGQATDAQLSFPEDMEIGPDGNLYFADADNDRVRMINLTTGVITTVAGTGVRGYSGDGGAALEAQLNRPFGVAFDAAGDLYVSDTFNSRIRKVKLTGSGS
jgi:sugar lactone lactonase YvrE